jgi:hypothetical protein
MTGEATPYIGDVLNAAFASAQAVVVLLTPELTWTKPSARQTIPKLNFSRRRRAVGAYQILHYWY